MKKIALFLLLALSLNIKAQEPNKSFSEKKVFFTNGAAKLQGKIEGYTPEIGFNTFQVFNYNSINSTTYPILVNINSDGTFTTDIQLQHSFTAGVIIKDYFTTVYLEPNETLDVTIDLNVIAENAKKSNNKDKKSPVKFEGKTASISRIQEFVDRIMPLEYNKIVDCIEKDDTAGFIEYTSGFFKEYSQLIDSICKAHGESSKEAKYMRNFEVVNRAYYLLDYATMRKFDGKKADYPADYYDFLKDIPMNDETVLAQANAYMFINRFKYSAPLEEAANIQKVESKYPKTNFYQFVKNKGITLTADEEEQLNKANDKAGKTLMVSISELMAETRAVQKMIEKYPELYKEFDKKINEEIEKEAKTSDEVKENKIVSEEQEKQSQIQFFNNMMNRNILKDKKIAELCGVENSFISQILNVQDFKRSIELCNYRDVAELMFAEMKKHVTNTVLAHELEKILTDKFPADKSLWYDIPQGEGSEILSKIIEENKGKELIIDFWATSCGPCISAIKRIQKFREENKNNPNFKFVFITGDEGSPKNRYEEFTNMHMKGETSYRLKEVEFTKIKQLLKFSAIPHYILIEKNGKISRTDINSCDLENFLRMRYNISNK